MANVFICLCANTGTQDQGSDPCYKQTYVLLGFYQFYHYILIWICPNTGAVYLYCRGTPPPPHLLLPPPPQKENNSKAKRIKKTQKLSTYGSVSLSVSADGIWRTEAPGDAGVGVQMCMCDKGIGFLFIWQYSLHKSTALYKWKAQIQPALFALLNALRDYLLICLSFDENFLKLFLIILKMCYLHQSRSKN
jgi:hypothetical protein